MAPEETPEQISAVSEVGGSEWDGPWGAIAPVPQSVETLCVQVGEAQKPRIYFCPYRTIGKWIWSMGTPEELEIHAGGILVKVSGTGLRRLADALDQGRLRLVQSNPFHKSAEGIYVGSVIIEEFKG